MHSNINADEPLAQKYETDDLAETQGFLRVVNVNKSFGHLQVLHNVSFDIGRGEVVCIIGPSGSGKSTALRCINRLEEPSSGEIFLDGVDMLTVDPDKLRRRVGMVFQRFNLFPHKTVLENIILPLRKVRNMSRADAEQVAMERLDEVGLTNRAHYRPANLSGGQQQRVAIGRALAMEPEVMLFDEVTSALDPELVKGVLELMAGLAQKGMTMIVVTHEMGFARQVADKVIFMADGRVIECGAPDMLFDNPQSTRLQMFLSQVL